MIQGVQMQLRYVLAALAALLVLPGGWAIPAPAQTSGTVSFCFNNWAPYALYDEGGASGISVDILRAAATRAGLRAEFEELPWNRCLAMVQQGDIDAVMDAATRPGFIQGPTSFSKYTNTFWVREDSPIKELSFSALRGLSVGLVDGYVYPDTLTKAIEDAGMVVETSVDDATAIRKLAFGRIDSIVADHIGTRHFIREHNVRIRALDPAHSADPLYPSFHPAAVEKQRAMDAALATMQAEGAIDAIYERYLGPDRR